MHQEAIRVIEEIDAERHVEEEFAEFEVHETHCDHHSVVQVVSFRAIVAVASICSVGCHVWGVVHVVPLESHSHEIERRDGSPVLLT